MIKNAFSNQFMLDLLLKGADLPLPNSLREVVRAGEIENYESFEKFLLGELENASIQSDRATAYFLFIAERALRFWFLRRDEENFSKGVDLFKHRMTALKGLADQEVPHQAWDQYVSLLQTAFARLMQHVPIETYEKFLNDLDWTVFDKSFISHVSATIGFVYMHEPDAEQSSKAKLWLQKAIHEASFADNYANYLFMAEHYLARDKEAATSIQALADQVKGHLEETVGKPEAGIFHNLVFLLESSTLINGFSHFDDPMTRLEHCQLQLKELEARYAQRSNNLYQHGRVYLERIIANLYMQLVGMTDDSLEQASFSKHANAHLEKAITMADVIKDDALAMETRLMRARIAVNTDQALTEKEMKEQVAFFKRRGDYPYYAQANAVYCSLLLRNDAPQKTYDLLSEVHKYGSKRLDQGGFYLVTRTLEMANDIFLAETDKPGVSWMVSILDLFFERIQQSVDSVEENIATIGKSQIEVFRQAYTAFEPASHFNIKVYYRYQWYEVKIMRIGALLTEDTITLAIADQLLRELEDDNNALSFIKADWLEFKKVPNSVRNKTLNKCINISKGDLPLAAEHLDFSYRNLRSYITFKEVNRLGFFLDMQQTNNRQLEQGIRYMFHDLYKNGTIFEVVFDMPRFLVTHAKTGFFSQDLEHELNIKGTTAKKYLKIMIEIGLVRQDKSTGRKHFYRLIRENVMNRLGKETPMVS